MALKITTYLSTAAEMLGYPPAVKKITVVRVEDHKTGLYVDSWKKHSQHANAEHARSLLLGALKELFPPEDEVPPIGVGTPTLEKAFTSLADAAKYSKECLMDFGKAEKTVHAMLAYKDTGRGFEVKALAWSDDND